MFFRIEFILISFISLSVICSELYGNLYKTASSHFVNLFLLLYSPVGDVMSNFTNHNVGFLIFTCVKILKYFINQSSMR